ncbi:uncharacterized protein MONBRDRAFT_11867 [Monosiga brevicollis MX1]|uniref:Transmembrane protein n=1 Tax=Monosiga brevicollis TaxID=81824 RepID=A9VAI7_MONBE|nr:uncharacterized protein MONBRDRAFT_11867 [Monosiga brevicollis MX1]EDQ85547.1 predicted protein [Monosiga brevicollis MX1]|eukprot:XP_001749738.1 hypothetical protein [Monosiga brevicollis MX1]
MSSWVFSNTTWGVCGVFALLSLIITCHQIYQHLFHWTKPIYQKWIVRILFMVPVYAFASWLSLKFYDDSVYFDTVRNCYESFVIYSFLSLCFAYLGGESALVHALTDGLFEEGDMDPRRGYLYVAIAYNISIFMAMMGLVWFYQATADLLACVLFPTSHTFATASVAYFKCPHRRPHKPVLKFLIVKSVIFLAFWQGMGLSIAGAAGAFRNETQVISPKDLVHDTIRNFSSKYNKYHHQSNAESDESDQEAPGEDEERRVGLDPINEAAPGSMAAMDPDRFSVGSWGEETAMGHVRHLKQPDARQSLMQPDSDEEGNSII